MQGWKGLFREHTLERGRNYFCDGAVIELEKTESGYQAVVEGTEEDGNGDEIQESWMERRIRVSKELAERDDEIHNMILTKYAIKIDVKHMNRLEQQVDNIVYQYGDRSGFIDYRNAWYFTSALEDFLNENVDTLIDRQCYLQAFEMTNYVFKIIGNIDMDDSDGGTSYVADACYEKWSKILENCNDEEKDKMFSWFMSHQGCGYVIDYMEDYMEQFLMNEFQDRMEKLNYSSEEIKAYRKKNWRFSAVRKLEIQENIECGNNIGNRYWVVVKTFIFSIHLWKQKNCMSECLKV